MPFLIFSMCYENHFKACTITKIFNYFSRANIFEQNKPEDFNNILRGNLRKYYIKLLGFIAVGVISLIVAIQIYNNNYPNSINWSLIGGLFLMAFITFILAIALYFDYRKMQHYSGNQIIKNI